MKSILFLILCAPLAAQTFDVGQSQSSPAASKDAKKKANAPASSQNFGWGSSIEVGRNSRAAEDNLKRGNYAAAANYAKRAVDAAPQNGKLWFLYGYTARMAGRYNESINAYKRGLQSEPNAVDGLSGLAQTYAKMGNVPEAKRLLQQVIAANPSRTNDLLIAGELFVRSGDLQQGLNYLERAESQQPSAHAELLMATAYMKMKQTAKAQSLLEKAKARDPKNTDIFRAVATFYRETKDYEAAIRTLKSAPRMKPDVLGDLAFSYEMAGHKKEAAATYGRAADAAPGEIGYALSAANSYLRMQDMETTRKFIARASKIDADHYRLHAIKAAVAKTEGRNDIAIQEYTRAIAKLPEVASEGPLYPIQLRLNLADLYRSEGQEAAAKQQMAIAEQEISKIEVGGEAKAEFLRVRASIRANANELQAAEADLKEAMQLDPQNTNIHLQYANLLWRQKRKDEAQALYNKVLAADPKNRYALEGMGYIARENNDQKLAEKYFTMLAQAYPDDAVGFLALGDMYTQLYQFDKAEVNYEAAYKAAPKNSAVVANGANAAIEARKFDLAKQWIARATPAMQQDPRVMREIMRTQFHDGKYLESAQMGYRVLDKLPKDRNASVYLAYDLYNLGRYDDVLALSSRYEPILPREPNFPLLMGHVHKQTQLLNEAVDDYTRAIERDPKMVEAYVNRGYVLNDLQNAESAIKDFDKALELAPKNGVAHLGIAFSDLQMRRSAGALEHVQKAEDLIGKSGPTYLVRATAYRQQRVLDKAEYNYREALKLSPDDLGLRLALADTLYHAKRYQTAINELSQAMRLSPEDPFIYAQMATAHAHLRHDAETKQYIAEAEKQGGEQAPVLLATGEALLVLGDNEAAMDRLQRALTAPDSNRVDVRLAIARLFAKKGNAEDAKQQVSLALAESRVGEAPPVSADNFIEAANILLQTHDFDLARAYFDRARAAGGSEQAIAIGLANSYLATGDANAANAELTSIGSPADMAGNYDYQLTKANVFRQRHENVNALGAFARANAITAEDDVAQRLQYQVAEQVGARISRNWTASSNFSMSGIFEDSTIYALDQQFFAAGGVNPPPRSSLETKTVSDYRYWGMGLPILMGVGFRTASGQTVLPSESIIVRRNTLDTDFHSGVEPVLKLGNARISLNTGIQFTIRRDKTSPVEINQNLFRQYAYFSTTPFFNWVGVKGSLFHESGGFSRRSGTSRDVGASVEFAVGHPWGKNSLITGWSARDYKLDPLVREFFTTSTWVGFERKFSRNFTAAVLGEYIRSWRVQDLSYALAQAMRPAVRFNYSPSAKWNFEGKVAFERGQGIHTYDNVNSGFFISYVQPYRARMEDGLGVVPVEYPIRISVGIQQEQFMNYSGRGQSLFRPVIRLSLF